MKHVHRVKAKGREYCYFRPTGEKIKAPYGSAEFLAEVEALERKWAGHQKTVSPGTLGHLVFSYRASPEFRNLADETKKDYNKAFDWLLGENNREDMPVETLTSPMVLALRDSAYDQRKRRFANNLVSVISLLCNWGKPRDLIAHNPVLRGMKIRRPKDQPHLNRAWGMDELEAVLTEASAAMRVGILLMACTAMRSKDALKTTWRAYDGTGLRFVQSKTSGEIWVPIPRQAKVAFDAIERKGVQIVLNEADQPYTSSGYRSNFTKLKAKLEAEDKVRPGLTLHGLRHTMPTMLFEAGASLEQIMSLCGHLSPHMVLTYTRSAKQRKRVQAVLGLMEQNTPEVVKLYGLDCKTAKED